MVKARKGLIISLFTLLVALVVTTSSTYAWFAMNQEVSATNMQVTIKSDNTYLVITNDSSTLTAGKFSATASDITVAETAAAAQVFPAKFKALSEGTPTWETAAGTSYNDGSAQGGIYSDIAADKVGNYVAEFNFWVGLNPSVSVADAENLKVKEISLASSIANDSVFYDALSVLVVVGNVADEYVDAGHNATAGVKAGSNTVLADTVRQDGTAIPVKVYVYINGDNTNVKTANAIAANLGTYTVGVTFTVTPGHAA